MNTLLLPSGLRCVNCAAACQVFLSLFGVGAIGGVASVARSIAAGVASQGQTLLGGDIRFELNQREAKPDERAFLNGLGKGRYEVGMLDGAQG